ncbi:MAG: hypothetical protein AB4426_29030 [Xenococcaceae cyanobacterium]
MLIHLFLILGICLILLGFKFGLTGLLLIWFGVSFVLVGAAYRWLGSKVFGKQSDGTIAIWALLLLLPYLSLYWTVWQLRRLIIQEECCNEIAPGIWLGRRAFADELPDQISLIVDLTAELIEPSNVISGKTYICVPTLDASVPSDERFIELIQTISSWEGNIYIHCALGHGRAATVAAGTLFAKGLVDNVNQAEKVLKNIRPGVKLSPVQRQLLNRFNNYL